MGKFKIKVCIVMFFMILLLITISGCSDNASSNISQEKALEYPKNTITMIVPFNAGGGVDLFARTVAKYSEKYLGAPMAVINKEGAGGEIGWNEAAKVTPDGYTLVSTVLPTVIVQPLLREEGMPGYKTDDFEPIALFSSLPSALFVSKDVGKFKNIDEMVEYAKNNPGKLTVTSNGKYGINHMFTELMQKELGIKVKNIFYSGGAVALKDILAGDVDVMCANAMFGVQQADTLTMLGVASNERFKLAPDISTFKEQGYNLVHSISREIMVPKGTPQDIKEYLNEAFKAMAEDPEFIKDMESLGLPVTFMGKEELGKHIEGLKDEVDWIVESFKTES